MYIIHYTQGANMCLSNTAAAVAILAAFLLFEAIPIVF